jgi:hypothetical protein
MVLTATRSETLYLPVTHDLEFSSISDSRIITFQSRPESEDRDLESQRIITDPCRFVAFPQVLNEESKGTDR